MPPKNKYTDPKLRQEVKEEIQQSDKGGAPGQWSARKVRLRTAFELISLLSHNVPFPARIPSSG